MAHIKSKTPPILDQWCTVQDTTVFFQLNCPAGTIIDVHITYRLADQLTSTTRSNAVTGAVAGQVYYPPLNIGSGNDITAVGLVSIS